MKESLHTEIVSLANQISKIKINSSSDQYYNLTIKLYEKVILLKNLDFSIGESSLEGQLKKNNLHLIKKENDIDNYDKNTVQPLIETIKEMIPEMPENNFKTNSLNEELSEYSFEKKEPDKSNTANNQPLKLNDHFAKIFKVDVNDRTAFINKLFDDKADEYDKVMKKISDISDWKIINNFIYDEVKPRYKSWKNNLLVERRFLEIIKKQFK